MYYIMSYYFMLCYNVISDWDQIPLSKQSGCHTGFRAKTLPAEALKLHAGDKGMQQNPN